MRRSEFNKTGPRSGDAPERSGDLRGRRHDARGQSPNMREQFHRLRGLLNTMHERLNTMLSRLTTGQRLAAVLVAVILLYAVYKLVLCDPHFLEDTSRSFRHFIKFGIVLIVYGLGILAFFRNTQSWVVSVWHILYVGMLVLLTLLGVFDAVGGGLPLPVRGLTTTLFEFLISPVPLVVLVVVSRAMEMAPTKA